MSNKELKDHVWKMYHITIKDSRVRQLNKRLQRGKYPFPSSKANYEKVHAASKSRDVDLDKLF